ncbi:retrovirus-related pol polyprotein from transposon TNT 1-94 [Tanacetum coccineum]|uniref:Retrovirus-related pol polyprotein from transposon TNT 1-94 n=1 Tax=Tanacetum coccineum TaxID=301880 RepID=A0ABQ4YXM6_9ASTR
MIPKPFKECKYCGFNDHHSDNCEYYPGCEVCGSIAHEPADYPKRHPNSRKPKIANKQSTEPTKKVAYVNGQKHNLIIITQLCDANFKVLFTKTQGTIFNQNNEVILIAPKRRDVYVIDMSSYNEESNACFFAKASPSKRTVQHVRKGSTIEHHSKPRGLFSINKCLNLLHMDLFEPVKPQTISHNKYTLVIVDEYSRYTWVFFLKKKSDAADCIMSFIKKMENLNDVRVKELRSENGTEFRNHKLEEFCDEKGISQNFSSPYSREQNGVAERRNKTLIEAARTIGRSPKISYFYVFGCPVHIHNHKDHLGKFDEKDNDGFFLGYSPVAKASRVFNIRRQEMEETYHVTFSEDDEAISQSSTEGDAINFNENRSFHDDEFLEPRNAVSPEELPELTIADDHPTLSEHDHPRSADNLKPTKIQDNVINGQISIVQTSPTTISPSPEGILQPLIPQDRWSREKHIELVNIIGEPLAGITTRSRVRNSEAASAHECLYVNFLSEMEPKKLIEALKEEGWIIAMQEELNQFERNKMDVKSAFLNGKFSKEVYVQQPPGFESSEFPNHLVDLISNSPHVSMLGFEMKAYSDLDYAGCNLDRKSTSRGCQILGGKLVCWSAKKQSFVAMPSAEAEYVVAAGCCALVLWIKSQLADYDVPYDKVPIFCDNTSAIAISNNLVLHSRTKHIDIRYHFIRDHILKGDIELHFIPTHLQLADIFTKPLADPSFTRLVAELAEADSATKSITFTLSHFDKPLSFNLDVFSTVIGFKRSENFVLIPPKEIVKAGLEILGLTDKNDTSLSSSDLINSSLVKIKYLSLILEHLLGEAYTNENLKTLKPHHITTISFKTTLENETALTAHMCKVAEISPYPIKSLLPPFGEVNADDSADKSSSGTFVQPVTQPKAQIDLKPKKKRIPPFSKPKSSKQVKDVPLKKQVTETQPAKETVATADTTQSLGASESVEDKVNQPQTADAEKMDDDDQIIFLGAKRDDMDQHIKEPTDSYLHSMPDDKSEEASTDNLIDELTDLNTSAAKTSDPLVHLHKEISSLTTQVQHLESFITQKVVEKLKESVPNLIAESLKATLLDLISESLKLAIHEIIAESVKQTVKPMNKQFNAFNKLKSSRFVILQKELSKVLKTKMGSLIWMKVRKEHALSISEPAQTTTALVIHTPKEKASEDKVSEEEPSPKRIKFLIPNPSTTSPTPLSLILPQNITMGQFTNSMFKTTSSEYSSTPPRDESKGKGIETKENPMKDLIPQMEEGGSAPKMLNLNHFSISGKKMTLEDAKAQMEEMKRLADLKAKQEKTKNKLKKLSPAEIEAQAQKLAEYEAKRKSMLEEYNHYISYMADEIPISKISYKIDRIKTPAEKLGIPPPPELSAFGFPLLKRNEKDSQRSSRKGRKHQRTSYQEPESGIFFYNGNFNLVFQREEEFHLAPTTQLIRLQNAIKTGSPEAEEMFVKLELTIEARNDVTKARKVTSAGIKGLAECKVSASNLIRIQVKDIVKEVEDHLKKYSSAGMDISWYVEGIRWGFKDSQRWQYSDYPVTL